MSDQADRPVGVAIVGCAHRPHAWSYARALTSTPLARLVAVHDDDAALGHSVADDFAVPWTDDLAGLLASEEVEAVVVCSPTARHRAHVEAAAAAGLHDVGRRLVEGREQGGELGQRGPLRQGGEARQVGEADPAAHGAVLPDDVLPVPPGGVDVPPVPDVEHPADPRHQLGHGLPDLRRLELALASPTV